VIFTAGVAAWQSHNKKTKNKEQNAPSFKVGWVKRSEPTIYKYIEGGFGVKTNALIHPTHNLRKYDYVRTVKIRSQKSKARVHGISPCVKRRNE